MSTFPYDQRNYTFLRKFGGGGIFERFLPKIYIWTTERKKPCRICATRLGGRKRIKRRSLPPQAERRMTGFSLRVRLPLYHEIQQVEIFFAYAAFGAFPVVGDVFKLCSGGDAVFRIAEFFIVNPAAGAAHILRHLCFLVFCIVG